LFPVMRGSAWSLVSQYDKFGSSEAAQPHCKGSYIVLTPIDHRMTYHQVVSRILDSLSENNCWYETFEHDPVRTSEEAAKTRPGYTLHQGAKAMIVKVKGTETRFVMLVLPADLRFDNSSLKAQ
jgi:hypothetical protein